MKNDRIRIRVSALGLVMMLLFSVLASRLWFLQILAGEQYAEASTANYVRLVAVSAPRGKIIDRNGNVLVGTRSSLIVGIRRSGLRDREVVLPKLAKLLGLTTEEVIKRLNDKRVSPYRPVTIAEDVPSETWLLLRERGEEFPGVETSVEPVRLYPGGGIAAHVIGYVGEIGQGELEKLRDKGYRLGDEIGRAGVERNYEDVLRGSPGWEKLAVDSRGEVLRTIGQQEPVPGNDLQLTIDGKAQQVAEEALRLGIERARGQTFRETGERFRAPAGAVVVLEAKTGEVVAMASYPTYDLKEFAGGIDPDYWKLVNDPASNQPMLNRAIQAAYPPGSTFKPFMVAAALQTGRAQAHSRFPCLTEFFVPGDTSRPFRNWKPANSTITLSQALVESCDTPFYKMGLDWWAVEREREKKNQSIYETARDWARRFGLGRQTSIDLGSEVKGRIPGRDFKREQWRKSRDKWCANFRKTKDRVWKDLCVGGYQWLGGDAINMSIGQGDVLSSPLQVAVGYAAVANGGTIVQPHVAKAVIDPETRQPIDTIKTKPAGTAGLDPQHQLYIRQALEAVTERGTAKRPFAGWPFDRIRVASKTGSAEIGGKQPYSWFAAFAPAEAPRYVVVSVVEEAGFGSQVSGPIVRRVMDHLFGLPLSPIVYDSTRSD